MIEITMSAICLITHIWITPVGNRCFTDQCGCEKPYRVIIDNYYSGGTNLNGDSYLCEIPCDENITKELLK